MMDTFNQRSLPTLEGYLTIPHRDEIAKCPFIDLATIFMFCSLSKLIPIHLQSTSYLKSSVRDHTCPGAQSPDLVIFYITPGVSYQNICETLKSTHIQIYSAISSIYKLPRQSCSTSLSMFLSLLRSLPQLGRRWKPLDFSNPNFVRIPEWQKTEEETLPDYTPSQYYPTRIGEVIKERYQVIGKLGFGSTSTAWLARDMK